VFERSAEELELMGGILSLVLSKLLHHVVQA